MVPRWVDGLYLTNHVGGCRKFILGRDIGWGLRCATSWCDLNLAFHLALVTLSFKILSGLYLGKCKCRRLMLDRDIGSECRCAMA